MGAPAIVEVVLVAKGDFKVNDEYPVKFRLTGADGLKAPNVVDKSKSKVEHKKLTLEVGLTPEAAGKKRLDGTFHFSVCTHDKCLIEHRDLSLELDVH